MRAHHVAEAALIDALARAQRLHDERAANEPLNRALLDLADWQSRRLLQTYADLVTDARYRAAIDFFRSDLYGNETMARRDADLARLVPAMVAMLPERVIATVAKAMELNVLSHTLDREMQRHLSASSRFTVADYCDAYRRTDDIPGRHRQIRLIVEVGRSLDSMVRKPLLRGALSMMRKPARIAGLSTLHDFLERGFDAFRRMHGAATFLATIETRETALCNLIVAGATNPFPEPLTPSSS